MELRIKQKTPCLSSPVRLIESVTYSPIDFSQSNPLLFFGSKQIINHRSCKRAHGAFVLNSALLV